jgi:hypothetical protein
VTITKDDLRQFTRRDKLARIATHIEFLNAALNVLPNYPANEHDINSYLAEMEKACKDMEVELSRG